jgi:hypothetical protein
MLSQSQEAWVHVWVEMADAPATAMLAGFGRVAAVLTWDNSD